MQKYKYVDVDIISCLESFMRRNTKHYHGDFEYDKAIIDDAAKSENKNDSNYSPPLRN